jgi:hypothetical protein
MVLCTGRISPQPAGSASLQRLDASHQVDVNIYGTFVQARAPASPTPGPLPPLGRGRRL